MLFIIQTVVEYIVATQQHSITSLTEEHQQRIKLVERLLWAGILLFTAADILSTWYVIDVLSGVETIALSKWALATAGWLGMVLKDVIATAVVYLLWRVTPLPYRVSILLGATLPRVYATIYNLGPVV